MQVHALKDMLKEANARHEKDTAALSKRLDVLQKELSFLGRRNKKLSDQLGFLNEFAIRQVMSSNFAMLFCLGIHPLKHDACTK